MIMRKLALATLVAMGMTAAAIAQQQPGQQPSPSQRSTQPTQPSTQPRPTQPTQPSTQAPAPRGGDRTEQVSFERADKNADGRINREEANDIDGFDFSRADTNNDASLSRQEYQAAMTTATPRGGPAARNEGGSARSGDASAAGQSRPRDEAGGGRDARDDDRDERGQGQRSAQVSFDTADKDKDGKVTRAEAADVPGLNFSSADTNADASLSRQEFQVAMAGAQPRG